MLGQIKGGFSYNIQPAGQIVQQVSQGNLNDNSQGNHTFYSQGARPKVFEQNYGQSRPISSALIQTANLDTGCTTRDAYSQQFYDRGELDNINPKRQAGQPEATLENMMQMMKAIKSNTDILGEKVESLEGRIRHEYIDEVVNQSVESHLEGVLNSDAIKKRIYSAVDERVDNAINGLVSGTVDVKISVASDDFQERQWRKRNVLVINLPESNKKSVDDKKMDDLYAIHRLFNRLVRFDEEDLEIMPVRLGRIGENPRILRATFMSEAKVKELVQQAREKNDIINPTEKDNKRKIYINRDYSAKDRETRKLLLDEKKRREALGEKNIVIKGDKLVIEQNPPHLRRNRGIRQGTQNQEQGAQAMALIPQGTMDYPQPQRRTPSRPYNEIVQEQNNNAPSKFRSNQNQSMGAPHNPMNTDSQYHRELENQRNNAPGRYPAQEQNRQDRGSNQHIQAQSGSYMDQNEQNRSQNNISKGLETERQLREYQYQLNRPRTRSSLRNAEIGSRLSPAGRGMPPQRDNPPMSVRGPSG